MVQYICRKCDITKDSRNVRIVEREQRYKIPLFSGVTIVTFRFMMKFVQSVDDEVNELAPICARFSQKSGFCWKLSLLGRSVCYKL